MAPVGQFGFSLTQPYSYKAEYISQLEQEGYQPINAQTKIEAEICLQLTETTSCIKNELFAEDKAILGLEGMSMGDLPHFFVHIKDTNTFYRIGASYPTEYFAISEAFAYPGEIVCHEFIHAVIANVNPLGHEGEAGALNEAIADVVGVVFERRSGKKNWNIKLGDSCLRDLKEPFKVEDLKDPLVQSTEHIHHNSRLVSHAFYQAYQNLPRLHYKHKPLLRIWWQAILQLQPGEKTFEGFANKTITVSHSNSNPIFHSAVRQAWISVGFEEQANGALSLH